MGAPDTELKEEFGEITGRKFTSLEPTLRLISWGRRGTSSSHLSPQSFEEVNKIVVPIV